MNVLHNKVVLSAAAAVGLLVWGPKLLETFRGEPADEVGDQDLPDMNAELEEASEAEKPAQPPSGRDLDAFLEAFETLAGSAGANTDLDALLAQPPAWEEPPAGGPPESGAQGGEVLASDAPSGGHEPAGEIESWLEQAPLSAIVVGEHGAWALLGGRVVRPGDVLLPDLLTVVEIRREGILLRAGDQDLPVELPPFRARPAESRQDQDQSSGDRSEGAREEEPSPEDTP